MSTSLASRAPGAYISFVDLPPAIEPARVDVAAFVCVTERGPLNTPVRCGSWATFQRVFGDFTQTGLGAYALKAFFDGGGQVAWVVRVAAPARATVTTGPLPADRGHSVVAALDGLVPGAAATISSAEGVHTYAVVGVDPVTMTVTWDRPLHPDFTILTGLTVASGAGAASAIAAGGSGTPAVAITAASPGAWGDRVDVTVSPGRRIATASRPDEPGSPTILPVLGTAGFVVGDLCLVGQDYGGVVTTVTTTLTAIDPARRVLSVDPALPASIDPTRPLQVSTVSYSLAVRVSGATVEVWPDLSSTPGHPRYAPDVLLASDTVRAEVLAAEPPAPAIVSLRGGRDGTAALRVGDLLGDEVLGDGIGLAALHDVDEPAVVSVPDLVAPASALRVTVPPPVNPCDPCGGQTPGPDPLEAVIVEARAGFSVDEIAAGQQQLIESCEASTERIALLDPPGACRTSGALRDWAARFSSSYAVTIAPWVTVVDPLGSGGVRPVPASGHLAGLIAACDAEAGPWLSPANRTLTWAAGLDLALTDAEHALANDAGLNLIRALPGRGLVPMGSRTLSPDTAWLFVAVRRTMILLRRTLRLHLAWVVFEPANLALADLVTSSIHTLLTGLWHDGALAGDTADDSFGVRVDTSLAASGEFVVLVGVALASPSEFVTVRVSRTDNRLDLTDGPVISLTTGSVVTP